MTQVQALAHWPRAQSAGVHTASTHRRPVAQRTQTHTRTRAIDRKKHRCPPQAELSSLVAAAKAAASQAARLHLLDREVAELQRLLALIRQQVASGQAAGADAVEQQVGSRHA